MNLRPPTPEDTGALLAFFLRVPDGERTFFKERAVDRETVEAWVHAPGRRAIAIDGDAVVGHVAVVPLPGLVGSRRRAAADRRPRAARPGHRPAARSPRGAGGGRARRAQTGRRGGGRAGRHGGHVRGARLPRGGPAARSCARPRREPSGSDRACAFARGAIGVDDRRRDRRGAAMTDVRIEGLKIRIRDIGDGPPVLLINGLGAPTTWWATLEAASARATADLVRRARRRPLRDPAAAGGRGRTGVDRGRRARRVRRRARGRSRLLAGRHGRAGIRDHTAGARAAARPRGDELRPRRRPRRPWCTCSTSRRRCATCPRRCSSARPAACSAAARARIRSSGNATSSGGSPTRRTSSATCCR